MTSAQIQYKPSVLVSLDGERAIEVVRFDGRHGVSNRDATGFYFTLRASPRAEPSRVYVMFSGSGMAFMKPASFGVPDYDDETYNFVLFAEAAIGEYLDEGGELEPTPSGVSAHSIECFSDRFEGWKERQPATDDQIEHYTISRLFWAWTLDHQQVDFTTPDFLRLGITAPDFFRLAKLLDGERWKVANTTPAMIQLSPIRAVVQEERLRRRGSRPAPSLPAPGGVYVEESRIAELRAANSGAHDLQRLVAMCEELNACWANNCLHAVAMITRAIIDHVPPIFGVKTFNEVASNYPGSKSFRDSMAHLSASARRIADAHLHTQVRRKETLPTRTQVDFSRDLDVLLGEIVRIS